MTYVMFLCNLCNSVIY